MPLTSSPVINASRAIPNDDIGYYVGLGHSAAYEFVRSRFGDPSSESIHATAKQYWLTLGSEPAVAARRARAAMALALDSVGKSGQSHRAWLPLRTSICWLLIDSGSLWTGFVRIVDPNVCAVMADAFPEAMVIECQKPPPPDTVVASLPALFDRLLAQAGNIPGCVLRRSERSTTLNRWRQKVYRAGLKRTDGDGPRGSKPAPFPLEELLEALADELSPVERDAARRIFAMIG